MSEFDRLRGTRQLLVDDRGQRYFEDERGIPVFEHIVNAPTWAFEDDTPTSRRAEAIRVSDVQAKPVRWLWPGRIPRGKLTVLDGDPGLGKSTLTLDLTARVTTGSPLPSGERLPQPAGVLLLSAEDAVDDTIRPRLEAAGANIERVYVLQEVPDFHDDVPKRNGSEAPAPTFRTPSLPGDVMHLEFLIRRHHVALVVVDPLVAFLPGSVNTYRDQDVRRALHALAAMADRTHAAVLVLRHLSKTGGPDPVYRGGGSIGIIGAARSGLLVARDPQDHERRILAMTKSNLARMPEALAFRLVPDELRDCSRIVWEGPTTHQAADLLVTPRDDEEGPGARDEAVSFLDDLLSCGPVSAKQVRATAREAGIAPRTLDRAKATLGVRSVKLGAPGEAGRWMWELPRSTPPEPEVRHPYGMASFGDVGDLREHTDPVEGAPSEGDR